MDKNLQRRHSRWYEKVAFNQFFLFILGFVWTVFLPAWNRWDLKFLDWPLSPVEFNTLTVITVSYVIVFFVQGRLTRFPGTQSLTYLLSLPIIVWSIGILVLFFSREEYSRQVLFVSVMATMIWVFVGYLLGRKHNVAKLALVPFGRVNELTSQCNAIFTKLSEPTLKGRRFDAVVADLHSADLPGNWEKFLAKCTLYQIPVYHFKQVEESMTGRVRVEHLSENIFGALLPSQLYGVIKRFLDISFVILLLPLWLPIVLITAIAIKLESKGPVFYTQQRIGYKGRIFKMYKLRSMYIDVEGKGFTSEDNDPRITKVGRIIRKYRIDEIPQFVNVLKGDMSFIGPRPESLQLAEWYEKDVSFFSYRHIVRPGISGWAQVNHGYAAEIDGMEKKLQYDFFYIKYFSFWLDLLIVIKTVRVMLTGFGAR